jgi:Domain of unknown function (DUF4189)
MRTVRPIALIMALSSALLLSACGGDGDNDYGAIAFSPSTSRAAIATGGWTQSEANDVARDECDVRDCSIVLQFRQCGAISSGTTAGGRLIVGVAEGRSAREAQTAANTACAANGGNGCREAPGLAPQCN